MNARTIVSVLAIWLAMGLALTVAAGCEPESGPPNAKTDGGKDLRGVILNDDKSAGAISIYSNWKGGDDPGGAKPTRLPAGEQANLSKDWDGLCIPKNRSATVRVRWGFVKFERELSGGQCMKISDGQEAVVTTRKK